MALASGTRLGAYEIVALIGAGGMGEVYRARDARLGRDVAYKILPDSFAHDPDRLARFEREAKTLAALSHPNIAIIHGFEDGHGIQALVMELVEGPTLADRIARGSIPLEEALAIARQIAEALEAAHEHGIIHRDLKPRNGTLSRDGRWLAYESDSSGKFEIYVRPFPGVGDGQWQISSTGGTQPMWAQTGRELFYLAPDGAWTTVRVEPRGATWSAGAPTKLFEGRYTTTGTNPGRMYDVSSDGQRFLVIKPAANDRTAAAPPSIVVVQNWFEELKRLVPTR
jgi:serine/threonine protein kinase